MVLQIDDGPKTTGLDNGHRLRVAHRGQDALDLLAQSGDKFRADARAAGFDSFIVKPPALKELEKALLLQET